MLTPNQIMDQVKLKCAHIKDDAKWYVAVDKEFEKLSQERLSQIREEALKLKTKGNK